MQKLVNYTYTVCREDSRVPCQSLKQVSLTNEDKDILLNDSTYGMLETINNHVINEWLIEPNEEAQISKDTYL